MAPGWGLTFTLYIFESRVSSTPFNRESPVKSMVFGGHRFLSLVSSVFPLALLSLSFDVFVGESASGIVR